MRIVSLSALATRFVIEIGVAHILVGIGAESSGLPGLADLPVVDLAAAHLLEPDLVLVASLPAADDPAAQLLRSSGARLIEFAPHDLEDVFALCRGLGAEIAGVAAATMYERRISRPLGLIGGDSPTFGRPRVVAVVGFAPLELAGGHSFETDLIEIAGGSSITHGGDENRMVISPERLDELAPDLVLVATTNEMTPEEKGAARAAIPSRYHVEFFAFDRETFWLHAPKVDAARLHALIQSLELERAVRQGS